MGEYINKLEVIELADDILHIVDELRSCSQIDYHAYSELFDNLCGFDTIPAADVAPVVHGRLIKPNPFGNCSVCGFLIDIRDYFNYCPNCGAKMDLKERDNEKD